MLFQSLQARFRLQDFYMMLNSIGKDFLHMNWADMTRGSRKELSSALQQQSFKAYYHEDDAGHPYLEITVLGVLEDQQVLYDFITGIYGAPTLTANDDTLTSHYQKYCQEKRKMNTLSQYGATILTWWCWCQMTTNKASRNDYMNSRISIQTFSREISFRIS